MGGPKRAETSQPLITLGYTGGNYLLSPLFLPFDPFSPPGKPLPTTLNTPAKSAHPSTQTVYIADRTCHREPCMGRRDGGHYLQKGGWEAYTGWWRVYHGGRGRAYTRGVGGYVHQGSLPSHHTHQGSLPTLPNSKTGLNFLF